ncbi:hypothetical protein GF319_00710 [Candidatus Bathyarchaeota archaeon]|nr:hypothetical protein [Candidatus Bathyarchaeota archaeon]
MYGLRFGLEESAVQFSTNCRDLYEKVLGDYERYRVSDASPEAFMEVYKCNDFPISVPEYALREAVVPPEAAIYSKDGLLYLEEKGKRVLRIDPHKNRIHEYGTSPEDYYMLTRFSLKWMLIKALEMKGVSYIHGSGVRYGDDSYFFTGPPKHGKTRNLVTFLDKGGSFITDDTIFYGENGVIPFQIKSKIIKDLAESFPDVHTASLGEDSVRLDDLGWLVDLTKIYPCEKKYVDPSNLFFLYAWNSRETKIKEIAKKEMLSRLIKVYKTELASSYWYWKEEKKSLTSIFQQYGDFVDKARCYVAFVGSDPEEAFKSITEV